MATHVTDKTGMAEMVARLLKLQPAMIYDVLCHDLGTHLQSKQFKSKYTVLRYAIPSHPPPRCKRNPPPLL